MDKDLVDVAHMLASQEPSAPRQALLRRAASTAYYAVFHALAARCADAFVADRESDWETYTLLYRALDHNSARRLFEGRDLECTFGPEIATFAVVFITLQQARILADYVPHPFSFGRMQVTELVEQSRDACHIIDGVPADRMRRLAAHLIVRPR
jgi:hypothetical protein